MARSIKYHFSTKTLLQQRGKVFESAKSIYKDTLISDYVNSDGAKSTGNFFKLFNQKENRDFIKRSILSNIDIKLCDLPKKQHGLFDDVVIKNDVNNMKLYSNLFEWYVSHLLLVCFNFHDAEFGVELRKAPLGEDFDVLARASYGLVHVECKSGNPRNIKPQEIKNFIKRCRFLNSDIGIFYVDYKNISRGEALFSFKTISEYLGGESSNQDIWKLTSKSGSSAVAYRPEFERIYFVDCRESDGNVEENIRLALDLHFSLEHQERQSSSVLDEDVEGFDSIKIYPS